MEAWLGSLGTPLQFISSASLVAILGVLLRNQIENRRARNAEDQTALSERTDIRDHYAKEVQALRTALASQSERHRKAIAEVEDHYKERAKEADERHAICLRDREELRDKVEALKDLVAGLRRIITANSAAKAIEISDQLSDDVRAAAERVDAMFRPHEEEANDSGR